MNRYTVKRYVVEYYEVEAETRENAIEKSNNEGGPWFVDCRKITVIKQPER